MKWENKQLFGTIFRGDRIIWIIFFSLCLISILSVYSATSTIVYKHQNQYAPVFRHVMFLFLGFGAVMALQRVKPKFIGGASLFILLLSYIFLIYARFFGTSVNGAQRWVSVGLFSFQPSEVAKISLLCVVAFFLSRLREHNFKIFSTIIWTLLGFTCLFIAIDNLSTALLLGFVVLLLMFIAQYPWKILAKVVGALMLIGGLGFALLFALPDSAINDMGRLGTWKARLVRHGGESNEPFSAETFRITDENYQVSQAKVGIAKAGIIDLPGSGSQRDFIPQAYSDFIFAVILEDIGLLGGLFVVFLYIMLLIRCGMLAYKSEKSFNRYLILGCALMIGIQAFINIAVGVNLIPVTGQPLPLISRGGTSTIITCLYIGIILCCSQKQNVIEHNETESSLIKEDFGIAENE